VLRSTPYTNTSFLIFFGVERATLAKFGLHANKMKFNKLNEKWINVCTTAPVYTPVHNVQ